METKQNTINDIINELKRLQVEIGKNLPVVRFEEYSSDDFPPAWPVYNEEKERIEF